MNFYQTSCLINTSFLVAHDRHIFIYDIIKEEWVNKFTFGQKVLKVFRNEKYPGIFNLGILYSDGTFGLLENDDYKSFRPDKWCFVENKHHRIDGKPRHIASDIEHFRMLYVLSKNELDNYQLQAYTRDRVHIFERQN